MCLFSTAAAAQPMPTAPGTSRASFLSTTELQWDVTVNQQPACATPCQLVIPPGSFVTLHSHENPPVRLELGFLPPGDVAVGAEPLHRGQYAAGITFTTLGAMALATGITLGAVGYGTDDSGLKTAGFATGIPGAVVMVGAIYLMQRALPQAHIQAAIGGMVARF